METIDIHGFTLKYDLGALGSAGRVAVSHLREKVDKEEAEDLFNNARRDNDRTSRFDFYDREFGRDRKMEIFYLGDGTYRLRKAE